MHPNQQSIETFYGAFARLDQDTPGAPGHVLQRTPMLRNKLRAQAGAKLRSFLATEGA